MERKDAQEQQEKQGRKILYKLFPVLVIASVSLAFGAGVTALAVRINQAEVGVYLLPFLFSASIFLLSTIGFFLTEGKKEMLYGACSILGATCAIVQLALIF